MACENCNTQDDIRSVIRQQNRALRTVVRLLRRKNERIQASADTVVAALFDEPSESELAFSKLWESGEFICGPQDYDEIVKQCVEALRFSRGIVDKVRHEVQTEQVAQGKSPESVLIKFKTNVNTII